ncbi:methylated-DNA--[protein]-cysteine S-methyltransferase [Vannielia litorea]|uniref:methylated-DNA--[protein]-cysteine S-methyltransferase n=1 Tax=Vannielia litorea TaxID=1217970 RepID=UPI001C93BBC7|nr:methylated-DNA--[protein]-cysteine S-methyltransferase [Vannielia litorea]MBY6048017.1 methylated-DNA--[protein]-cysteine S-methyltransferase [Vannielia litorea]MBY6075431.1 methylated-DNA--[protein]-cysteine S-methyltransferase [Vannielia litorea]
MATLALSTPVGRIVLTEAGGAITRIKWSDEAAGEGSPLLREAERQIGEYFAGEREDFDLPLRVEGSAVVKLVCSEMRKIPFGETTTYGAISKKLGFSAQSIGGACGANPIPLIIPCHRVLGASSLGGFSGGTGVETKVALLRHEGAAGLLI